MKEEPHGIEEEPQKRNLFWKVLFFPVQIVVGIFKFIFKILSGITSFLGFIWAVVRFGLLVIFVWIGITVWQGYHQAKQQDRTTGESVAAGVTNAIVQFEGIVVFFTNLFGNAEKVEVWFDTTRAKFQTSNRVTE